MKSRARSNAGPTFSWMPGRKRKPRKGRYLRGWMGRGKDNREMINRRDRHAAKQALRQEGDT